MTESDLKRALIKSLRAQDGEGFRIEDKYRIGLPDMVLVPAGLPGGLYEAKMIKGAKLVATPTQQVYLGRFHKPPLFLAAVIGYSERRDALYIGMPGDFLTTCRYVPTPASIHGSQWPISELLGKWYHDTRPS